MCGICGYVSNAPIAGQTLASMTAALSHRGPDASGTVSFEGGSVFCGLGHARLSIIDLAGGAQPMSNEDGTVWIVYNGEIYNHAELRIDLEKKGHRYRTRSDTETILHLYEEYGEKTPEFLRGMFAFAIWDADRKTLFAARDRLGIKPFYYRKHGDSLIFASEIKAIFRSGRSPRQLNEQVLAEHFSFGYVTNERTLFAGIEKLLPGHCLVCRDGNMKTFRYWDVVFSETIDRPVVRVIEELRDLFRNAVRMRLMSDVPLGVFLSGGLDSSAIAAVMANISREPIQAFTIRFGDKYYSESRYARLVADAYGIVLHEVTVTPRDLIGHLERLVWHNDLPLHFPASVALFLVSRKAREHVKVVLTGEGSDELFGGYGRYMASRWNLRVGRLFEPVVGGSLRRFVRQRLWQTALPLKLKKIVGHSFLYHSLAARNIIFDNYYRLAFAAAGGCPLHPDLLFEGRNEAACDNYIAHYETFPNADPVARMLYTDIKTYLEELLMKQDKMSMAASLESRVPFLDHKLVEYAATLPSNLKIRNNHLKYILKQVLRDLVPEPVIQRKKMGFPMPLAAWMREPVLNGFVREILLDEKTRNRGHSQPQAVARMLSDHESGKMDYSEQLWRLVNFEIWCRSYLDAA